MKHAKLIFCVGMMLAALSGSALTATTNGITWTYSVVNGGATISGSSRTSGAIEIPSKLGGYNVTSIGTEVFRNCSGLTGVTIPDTVKTIGTSAFRASGLSVVTLGNGVTTIGNSAFYGCSGLREITIPNSVTTIDNFAFYDCDGLKEVTLPHSVLTIGPSAFADCGELASVTIGRGVTKIGSYAFRYCAQLVSVTFDGNCPATIGDNVFTGVASGCCVHVNRNSTGWGVTIPGNWMGLSIGWPQYIVKFDANGGECEMDSKSVEQGKAIGELPVPTRINGWGAEFIGWFTSSGTQVTETTAITADMTLYAHWDDGLLYGDDEEGDAAITGVKNGVVPTGDLTIPAKIDGRTVTAIAERAFDGCVGLTSVTILGNGTSIGNGAFYGCTGLTNVTIGSVADTATSTTSGSQWGYVIILHHVGGIGDYAFYGCCNLKKVSIVDEYVGYIGNHAFSGCSGLVEVSVDSPEFDIGNIGDFAFQDCQMLQKLVFEGDTYEPTLGMGTFEGASPDCRAYIRHASSSYWPSAVYGSWNGIRIDYIDHVVTFDANGGTGGKSTVLDTGDTIVAPSVTRAGYSFAGWQPAVSATMPSNDVTYTAQWTPLKYIVQPLRNSLLQGWRRLR